MITHCTTPDCKRPTQRGRSHCEACRTRRHRDPAADPAMLQARAGREALRALDAAIRRRA